MAVNEKHKIYFKIKKILIILQLRTSLRYSKNIKVVLHKIKKRIFLKILCKISNIYVYFKI